jgi:hypothetical protein
MGCCWLQQCWHSSSGTGAIGALTVCLLLSARNSVRPAGSLALLCSQRQRPRFRCRV